MHEVTDDEAKVAFFAVGGHLKAAFGGVSETVDLWERHGGTGEDARLSVGVDNLGNLFFSLVLDLAIVLVYLDRSVCLCE